MNIGGKNKIPNRLWLARKRCGLGQKQVASLLDYHTPDQLSRYEQGLRAPALETALRLEIIYRTPLRVLYAELYEQLREELQQRAQDRPSLKILDKESEESMDEFCTYADLLCSPSLSQAEKNKVRSHITRLARKLAYL
jgi:transcriptional regulator with XRE-family HTH domain